MEKDKIDSLLDKYWKGETTVEEEKLIKQFFAGAVSNKSPEKKNWFESIKDFQGIKFGKSFTLVDEGRFFVRAISLSFFLKTAAILILVSSMVGGAILYHQHKSQAEKNLELQNELVCSLVSLSKELNQGYYSLKQSAGFMTNVKPMKK